MDRRGRHEFFAQAYTAYLPRVLNYVRLRVDNEALAQDLTALTFERALTHLGTLRDKGAFGTKVFVYDSRHVGDPRHLRGYREARGSTGYCSQDTPVLHFGVPAGESYDVKAVFMDGTFFIAKGVVAPAEIVIDPNAPIR